MGNNLSICQHSKYNQSVFVMFDHHIIAASNLLTSQFLDPFKLKKRTKIIFVNGECYEFGDFFIYFGQISLHTSPADYVVLEIEYRGNSQDNKSDKILQDVFHFIATPIPRIIVSQNVKINEQQSELEMDVENENKDETMDVYAEMSNEKGEQIQWKSQDIVDFSKLDIGINAPFDGRHLSALYSRAFALIQ